MIQINEKMWMAKYNVAVKYKNLYGHVEIPRDFKLDGVNIGWWIGTQRCRHKQNQLPEKQVNLLNALGMVWDAKSIENNWERSYLAAAEYYKENGNLLVPFDYKVGDIALGNWIHCQRGFCKNQKLSTDKIMKLNAIGMVWDVSDNNWENNFALAEKYFETHGHLDVSKGENAELYAWLVRQKRIYRKNKMTSAHKKRLEKIGIVWDKRKVQWDEKFAVAKKYYLRNGDLSVPYDYEEDGVKLGIWVSTQRTAKKEKTLSAAKIRQLESIGMVWNARAVKVPVCPICGERVAVYKSVKRVLTGQGSNVASEKYGVVCVNGCFRSKPAKESAKEMYDYWKKNSEKVLVTARYDIKKMDRKVLG